MSVGRLRPDLNPVTEPERLSINLTRCGFVLMSHPVASRRLANRTDIPRGSAAMMQGCPVHDLREKLRQAGLRPTRQRVALGWLLFAKGNRHITAERLFEEAATARVAISLATVYNTLHQFTGAGLLREIAVDGSRTYFDTNVADHHHFLIEDTNTLVDIPGSQIAVGALPEIPVGLAVARVDVIIRVTSKS